MVTFLRTAGITVLRLCVVALAGLAGGTASVMLLASSPSAATSSPSSASPVSGTNYLSIYDSVNEKGIQSYVYDGYPAQNLYASDGNVRLQQGLYNKGAEAGLPLVGFWDNANSMRMLFRLAGANESPVIVMKDRKGNDRLVFGLSLNDPDQAPFMALIDKDGKKTMMFGSY